MKRLRWQLIIILLTGLVVGVLLLSQQPGGVKVQAPAPSSGGVYTEALIGSLSRLNPILDTYNQADQDVDSLLYSGLLRFDSRGIPQADLAESWGYSKDGTVYNFALRPNAKWHDGSPVTVDDVIFTIDLIKNENSLVPADLRAFWKDIQVKKFNETTVQFRLPEAFAPFPDYLTFGILPKHLLGGMSWDQIVNAQFNLQPVGSGPYQIDHLIVENGQPVGVALKANDKYYGKKPFIEQIVFRYYPTAQAAYEAYTQGNVQGISRVSSDILPKVLSEPNLALYTGRDPQLTLILLNLKNQDTAFLQDAALRKALFTGLNRQKMIDRLLNGQAVIADGPILPDTWAYYDGVGRVEYDPQAAARQLRDAGYTLGSDGKTLTTKDGTAVTFQLLYPDQPSYKTIAEAVQNDWANLGVKLDLQALPYDQLVKDHLETHQYQAALVDLNLSHSPDPDPYPFWDQAEATGGQNYSQWDSRIASEYLEQARITVDFNERARLYRNFQVIFAKELPALPLFYPVYTYAVDRSVQGVQMGPLFEPSDRFATVSTWYMVAKRPSAAEAAVTQTP